VQRGRLAGGGGVGGDHHFTHLVGLDPLEQLGDLQVIGIDAVNRRKGAAEHVIAARELVRALD
jgi:hypothetical protein